MSTTRFTVTARVPIEWQNMLIEASDGNVSEFVRKLLQQSLRRRGFPAPSLESTRSKHRPKLRDDVGPRQLARRKKQRQRELNKLAQRRFRERVKTEERTQHISEMPKVTFQFAHDGFVTASDLEFSEAGYVHRDGRFESYSRHTEPAVLLALKERGTKGLAERYEKFLQRAALSTVEQ